MISSVLWFVFLGIEMTSLNPCDLLRNSFLSKEKVYGGKWCLFYFVKKRKMYCVLCVYTEHPLVISENQLSCPLQCCCLLGRWAAAGLCVFPSQSSFLPSLPHRKQKAWAWAVPVSATSSSTDLACWLLWPCAMCLWCHLSFFLSSCLLLWERVTVNSFN